MAVAVLLAANTLALPSVPADPVVDDFGDGTVTDPSSIVLGLDGAMWFTATQNRVGAVTPDGAISSFGTGPSTYPKAITIGPDGNRWFVSDFHAGIGRATPEDGLGRGAYFERRSSERWLAISRKAFLRSDDDGA